MDLAEEVERRLAEIFAIVERIEEERLDEMERAGERPTRPNYVVAPVAPAPCASTPSGRAETQVKTTPTNRKSTKIRVS